MEVVKKLEATFSNVHKQSPVNLPDGARTWLATNAWWLVAVGVVLSVLSIIGSLRMLLWADSVMQQTQMLANSLGVVTPVYSQVYTAGLWISVATIVIALLINIKAIPLLKQLKKSGWDLLFLSFLVSIVGSAVSGLVQNTLVSTIVGLVLGLVIGGFVLFEVRSKFNGRTSKVAAGTGNKPAAKDDKATATEADK